MKSNFEMFTNNWEYLGNLTKAAEQSIYRDPSAAIIKIRIFAEKMTDALFELESLDAWGLDKQIEKLNELQKKDVLSEDIIKIFHAIRKSGNSAAHNMNGTVEGALSSVTFAHYLSNWFMEVYVDYKYESLDFFTPVDLDKEKEANLKILEEKIVEQERMLESQQNDFEKQLLSIQTQVVLNLEKSKERKKRSRNYVKQHPLNEAETRVLIDKQLQSVGWEADTKRLDYNKGSRPMKGRCMAIAEWPCKLYNGQVGNVDYALFDELKLVGVIEAKSSIKDVLGDLPQAIEYGKGIILSEEMISMDINNKVKAPFIYATNGRPYIEQFKEKSGIWFWDARTPKIPERALDGWHSPEDLRQKMKVNIDKSEAELKSEPYPEFADRKYQKDAVKAVEEAFKKNQQRMLLAMATGTGKTRTALSIMYRLIKTKRVRRVLFLVDRNSLGRQTADALKDTRIGNAAFSEIYGVKEVTDVFPEIETKIQIATVQGMVKRLFYQEDEEKIPSVGTFDFIIVDEAHRGYTEDKNMSDDEVRFSNQYEFMSQYRRVIDYFDATVLGLTATPALHTKQIFGDPIYTYTYTDAVVDGYLMDHEPPYKFETELSKNGIHFEEDEEIDFWNPDNQKIEKTTLPDEVDFNVEQFNKKVITKNFNRVILDELTNRIDPNEQAKTLIFAATDNHADMIVNILKEIYYEKKVHIESDAIMKITGSIRHPNEEIKRFKNEVNPNIVVTVDLLTTGIDVPRISNLVFMRRVRSRILYEQMLGRATRPCEPIEKESFRIFDAVHLYDHLKDITDMKPVISKMNQTASEILDEALQADSEEEFIFFKNELMAKLQRKKQHLSKEQKEVLSELNKIESVDSFIQAIKGMDKNELEQQTENIARIADFSGIPYKAAISHHEDAIVEEGVTRGYGDGNEKPDDYLEGFTRYIRENINLIPALEVVVNHPKDMTLEDLRSINIILKQKKFDTKQLQAAWRNEKKEFIAADIISFIRQAAIGSPLVDHETRIKNAMKKVYGLSDWNRIQEQWLKRIEKQLLKTTVFAPTAESYFEELQVFKDKGGYKKVKSIFGNQTDEIAEIINENLYA